jgi:AAA15 family ATPase/GTPase
MSNVRRFKKRHLGRHIFFHTTSQKTMKIKSVRLRNGYKRFFDLTIDLGDSPGRIVALVGPNGCGKSSVLDGILFQANPWGQLGNKQVKDHEYHSMNRTPNFGHENVLVTFVEGTFEQVRTKRAQAGREKTIFSFRSPYRYNSILKVKESRATSEIWLNSYGATTLSDLDDKMEENYRRLNIKYNKYLNEKDCKPSEAKAKVIADLNGSIGKCLGLEISSVGNIESSQGTLYFRKPDHTTEFEFDVLSSGEKEVVDILLDLYLRKDDYSDTIFLLDEPELHINTSIQKSLLIEINRLIGENCQLWITTHSIGFLRALQETLRDECQIVQFTDGVNLASTAQTLRPMQKTTAKWREIFHVALDDLSHLVSPRRIVYCEGRDAPGQDGRERGLDAQVFNNIFSEKYSDTLFISSGGNTELDQRSGVALAILSKVFTTVDILVLKDRDISSGRSTTLNPESVTPIASTLESHRIHLHQGRFPSPAPGLPTTA